MQIGRFDSNILSQYSCEYKLTEYQQADGNNFEG